MPSADVRTAQPRAQPFLIKVNWNGMRYELPFLSDSSCVQDYFDSGGLMRHWAGRLR